MNFGSGNIGYEIPSSGPGSSGARNGLSTNIGFNVIGQDTGQAGDPAILLSNREVPVSGFELVLIDKTTGAFMQLGNRALLAGYFCLNIDGSATRIPAIRMSNPNATTWKTWRFEASASNNGELQLNDQTGLLFRTSRDFSSLSSSFHCFVPLQDNTADVVFTNTVPRSRMLMTNRGAGANIRFTMNASVVLGYEYTFLVVAGFSILITAPGGMTIRNGGLVTAAGGTLTGAAVGSSIRIVILSATEAVAIAVVGAWV